MQLSKKAIEAAVKAAREWNVGEKIDKHYCEVEWFYKKENGEIQL